MSPVNTVSPGMRFRVPSVQEVKTPRGRLLARYHPAHPETGEPVTYGVTERNVKMINEMIVNGHAEAALGDVAAANSLASTEGTLKGRANTGRKGRK